MRLEEVESQVDPKFDIAKYQKEKDMMDIEAFRAATLSIMAANNVEQEPMTDNIERKTNIDEIKTVQTIKIGTTTSLQEIDSFKPDLHDEDEDFCESDFASEHNILPEQTRDHSLNSRKSVITFSEAESQPKAKGKL